MEYYSAIKRNAFESVLMRWMNLEPIMQSEVSQEEKDKYHILMHIYRINLLYLQGSIYSQDSNGEADIENRLMDMGRGERMTCVERVAWKLTLPYVKYIANRNLLYCLGNSNRDSVST